MLKVKEAILVEGKYDKAKLSTVVDALIIETDGFRVFRDTEKIKLIRMLAKTKGIIVFTDSDASGFIIRSFIKNFVQEGIVKHAYTPDIKGKEHRKNKPSKEGTLGLEGMTSEIILNSLARANIEIEKDSNSRKITKNDLYEYGLIGKNNSKQKRKQLLHKLELPSYISANELISLLNSLGSYNDFVQSIGSIIEI